MSGLINRTTRAVLPLRSSSIYADIKGFTARTTAILTYYNDNRTEIEGLFVLPLDHGSAIVDFECVIEGRYIYADVGYTNENDKMIINENTGDVTFDDMFTISIGKIPPWILIEIQVTLVCEITVIFFGDALKYTLPQTFSPKLASKLNFNTKLNQNVYTAVSTLGYTFQIEIFIEAPCLLCGVQSNSHPIQVDAPSISKTGAKIRVSLPDEFEPTNEIFELLMFLSRPREPYIIIEQPTRVSDENKGSKNPINNIMNNSILMLSYSPDISNFQKELEDTSTNQIAEFLLIFQSFSDRKTMSTIQDTCCIFLKSLPMNSFFNVLYIGDTLDALFDSSQSYQTNTLESSLKFVNSKTANQNTPTMSLIMAMKMIYQEKCMSNVPRQAFIICEGEHQLNQREIIDIARRKHHLARFFCLYMGKDDMSLYDSLSTITNGKSCHVENCNQMKMQLIAFLKAALKPAVTNLKISWILPDAYDVIYTPENLPVLYMGNRLNLYAIMDVKEHVKDDLKVDTKDKQHKPSSDSVTSIKEFWIEDYEFLDELTEQNGCSSHDLLTDDIPSHLDSPVIDIPKEKEDMENEEVFLTEEEAAQLRNKIGWQKRSSIDRVQRWRISSNPENDDIDNLSDTDYETYLQYQYSKSDRRKKSSSDGFESLGSSNSYGSNISSSSHFLAFPGYPTRLSSCRSVEARSPHTTKTTDDSTNFNFPDYTKERHLSTERHSLSNVTDDLPKTKVTETKPREKQKLTQALLDAQLNTHYLDHTNEITIVSLLESIVNEKRNKLNEWITLQEEMTQCTWPILTEKKGSSAEKLIWRDSGLGNRSSSEPHTSDLEDDHHKVKKSSSGYLFTKSFQGRKEQDSFETKSLNFDVGSSTKSTFWEAGNCSDTNILDTSRKKESVSRKTSAGNSERSFKKRFKPKNMWNSLMDKVKNITSSVSGERYGEATFKTHTNNDTKRTKSSKTDSMNDFHDLHELVNKDKGENSTCTASKSKRYSKETSDSIITDSIIANKGTIKDKTKDKTKTRQNLKARPLIENSRTISTSDMIEIGKTEIGDVDNLHLLPSQALIYLSGEFGNRRFKRLIPFQLDFSSSKEEFTLEFTIHQLAANSIIRDLEIQMDQDLLLENNSRNYVKSLVKEVSHSAHILSKYTSVVMVDDQSDGNRILSKVAHSNDQKRELSYFHHSMVHKDYSPLYEIHRERQSAINNGDKRTQIYHTKLILKSPHYNSPTYETQCKESERNSPMKRSLKRTDSFPRPSYMKITDLLTCEGYWEITHSFAEVLKVNFMQLKESCPFADIALRQQQNTVLGRKNSKITEKLYDNIWATTIALVYLNMYYEQHKDEWVLIDEKANKWLRRKKLPTGFSVDDIFLIAQQTLKILKSNSRCGSLRRNSTMKDTKQYQK